MKKIQLLFLGAPGSGKGTQSEKIVRDYGIIQLSTGDMLRNAVKSGTELGKVAKSFMDEGKLVTDDLIIRMMKESLKGDDCKNGFILDGFPRTIIQAESLDEMLKSDLNSGLTDIVSLEIPDELITERLSGRRVSPLTGKIYHIKFNPPAVNGMAEDGKTPLIHRDDDKPETIKERLKVYHVQSELVKNYYKNTGNLKLIDANRDPENIYKDIQLFLNR